MRAPWVQSGSSPASLTTAHRWAGPDRVGHREAHPLPPGSSTSTVARMAPLTSHVTAALAAAAAQVPVVQPVRRPVAPATSGPAVARTVRVINGGEPMAAPAVPSASSAAGRSW